MCRDEGVGIHGIVRIKWKHWYSLQRNTQLLINRSLSPAKISSVKIDDDNKKVDVYMNADQVSLAIGKGGYNIGLASRLTGYEIDVYRDKEGYEDDVDIKEFSDEIEEWIIDALKSIGCDTAKIVLSIDVEELVKRTDLEIETIKEVINT